MTTTTKREQILRAIVAKLNDSSKPEAIPMCERARAIGSSQPQLPLMLLYPIKEDTTRKGPLSVRKLTVRVDCRAAGQVGDAEPVDALTEPMIGWAVQALAGERLGGLVHDIEEESVEWQIEAADYAYVVATVDFTVSYQTTVADTYN